MTETSNTRHARLVSNPSVLMTAITPLRLLGTPPWLSAARSPLGHDQFGFRFADPTTSSTQFRLLFRPVAAPTEIRVRLHLLISQHVFLTSYQYSPEP